MHMKIISSINEVSGIRYTDKNILELINILTNAIVVKKIKVYLNNDTLNIVLSMKEAEMLLSKLDMSLQKTEAILIEEFRIRGKGVEVFLIKK